MMFHTHVKMVCLLLSLLPGIKSLYLLLDVTIFCTYITTAADDKFCDIFLNYCGK